MTITQAESIASVYRALGYRVYVYPNGKGGAVVEIHCASGVVFIDNEGFYQYPSMSAYGNLENPNSVIEFKPAA